jgi:hypothetical protein
MIKVLSGFVKEIQICSQPGSTKSVSEILYDVIKREDAFLRLISC